MGQWCDDHWAIVRKGCDDSTMNGLVATVKLMDELMNDERFVEKTGGDARAEVMNAVVAEVSPVCCFLGDEVMKRVYEAAREAAKTKGDGKGN